MIKKIPRPVLYVAAGVVALLLLIWLGSKCTTDRSDYDEERAAWESERDSLRREILAGALENTNLIQQIREDSAAAAPVIAEVDTLLLVVERERAAKNRALAELERRQREIADTTEMSRIAAAAIKAAQDARQEADTLRGAAVSLRGLVGQQLRNIAALTVGLEETQARADSAIALANRAPVYEGDKLLGLIPLPSRQTSFVIGGVVGATVTALIVRELRK